MRAGLLRHYISIEEYLIAGVDDRGTPIRTWLPKYEHVPASIEPLQGRQLELARQLNAQVTHRITFRYHSGITPKHRMVWAGRVFSIGFIVDHEERNLSLVALCTEEL